MLVWAYNLDKRVLVRLLARSRAGWLPAQLEGIGRVARSGDAAVVYDWSPRAQEVLRQLQARGLAVFPGPEVWPFFDRHHAARALDRWSQYPMPRRYFPAGAHPLPDLAERLVVKEGHDHQGRRKYLARPGQAWESADPFLVEPFVEGDSVRALWIGGQVFGLRYEADGWIKNMNGTVEEITLPEPLRADVERIAAASGLSLLAVDYILGERPHALEINVLPGLPEREEAVTAMATYLDRWVEALAGSA